MLRDGHWAPPGAPRPARDHWNYCRRWAASPLPSNAPRFAAAERRAKNVALGKPPPGQADRSLLSGANAAIYEALWNLHDDGSFLSWSARRSANRRWWPTDGTEWACLAESPSFNAAFHTLRLLAGGLSAYGSTRTSAERASLPRQCLACGSPDIAAAWITPSHTQDGIAWCAQCTPQAVRDGNGWALAFCDYPEAEDPPFSAAASAAAGPEPGTFPEHCFSIQSHHGACPLCRFGEFSSEHLLRWCPAVAKAWHTAYGSPLVPLCTALCTHGPERRLAVRVTHQASFLALALHGRSSTVHRCGRCLHNRPANL